MTTFMSEVDHARLCAVAESVMVDFCTITRPPAAGDQGGELNTTTLQYETAAAPPVIYAGKCEVDDPAAGASDQDAAGADWANQGVQVKLPVLGTGAKDVRRGDVVKLNTVAFNPALVDRVLTVDAIGDKTWSTKRRLSCKEGV